MATPAAIQVQPASMVARVLAVVVDFLFFYAIVFAIGLASNVISLPAYMGLAYPAVFIAVDLSLTAALGLSVGRAVAGVRVVRLEDGRAPGFRRASLRIALVLVTGLGGLLYWNFAYGAAHFWGSSVGPLRLWWDAAAGTALVRSTRWGPPPVLEDGELERLRFAYGGAPRR